MWEMRIKRVDDFIKFSKEIGFGDKKKQNKLNTIIEIKSMGQKRDSNN